MNWQINPKHLSVEVGLWKHSTKLISVSVQKKMVSACRFTFLGITQDTTCQQRIWHFDCIPFDLHHGQSASKFVLSDFHRHIQSFARCFLSGAQGSGPKCTQGALCCLQGLFFPLLVVAAGLYYSPLHLQDLGQMTDHQAQALLYLWRKQIPQLRDSSWENLSVHPWYTDGKIQSVSNLEALKKSSGKDFLISCCWELIQKCWLPVSVLVTTYWKEEEWGNV